MEHLSLSVRVEVRNTNKRNFQQFSVRKKLNCALHDIFFFKYFVNFDFLYDKRSAKKLMRFVIEGIFYDSGKKR